MEFISARSDVISQDTELPNPCNCDQAAIPVGSGWGRGVTVGPVGLLLPSGQRGGQDFRGNCCMTRAIPARTSSAAARGEGGWREGGEEGRG